MGIPPVMVQIVVSYFRGRTLQVRIGKTCLIVEKRELCSLKVLYSINIAYILKLMYADVTGIAMKSKQSEYKGNTLTKKWKKKPYHEEPKSLPIRVRIDDKLNFNKSPKN